MTTTINNANETIYEIIKSFVKLDSSITLKKDDYTFDDLKDEVKQALKII